MAAQAVGAAGFGRYISCTREGCTNDHNAEEFTWHIVED
jgi:hypothetical protein